jgi:hypothetical protein
MRRYLRSGAFAAVFVMATVGPSALPAAARAASPANGGLAAASRVRIATVASKPWGHWSDRAAPQGVGLVRAASEDSCLRDPLGDEVDENGLPAYQPKADLVSACARDTGTTITLNAATAVLSNPFTDPAWESSGDEDSFGSTGPSWMLWATDNPSASDDPSADQPIAYVSLGSFGGTLQAFVQVTGPETGQNSGVFLNSPACAATGRFVASGPQAGYAVSFPSSCLGQIGRFYWSVSMSYDPATDTDGSLAVGDQAPNSGPFPEVDVFPSAQGYWLAAADGGVFTYGSAAFHGSEGAHPLNAPVVAAAATPDGRGYYLAAADGGVFNHGDAVFHGSIGSKRLTSPIVSIAVTPDGGGYLLVSANGAVFSFGDAPALGSEAGFALTAPIVAVVVTPDNSGYWLFAADGGVFNFGDAGFFGAADTQPLNSPIVGAVADPDTGGYWLVGADGGVFSFDAPFYGSEGGTRLAAPVVGITSAQDGAGYRLVAADGGLFDFGAATFAGSQGGHHLNAPVVAAASLEG